jgi:hypothetical protein
MKSLLIVASGILAHFSNELKSVQKKSDDLKR